MANYKTSEASLAIFMSGRSRRVDMFQQAFSR
jgi:hypothetical protein